jgi:hypothetical protein
MGPNLGGQNGDIFSLCQSKIGAYWQINMSANWHLTPIGANWRRNWQNFCQFAHLAPNTQLCGFEPPCMSLHDGFRFTLKVSGTRKKLLGQEKKKTLPEAAYPRLFFMSRVT